MLAAQNPIIAKERPHQFFADSAGQVQTVSQVQQQVNAAQVYAYACFMSVLVVHFVSDVASHVVDRYPYSVRRRS